jgi:hypothetical protein
MSRRLLLLAVTPGVLGGCQIGPIGANKPHWPVDSVRIIVPTDPVPVGARFVVWLGGQPKCLPQDASVVWEVSDTSVLALSQPSCDQVGIVGKRIGRAELSVRVAEQSGSAPVFVGKQPAVASIRVHPAFAWVGPGDTLRLVATPLDSLGRPIPATFLTWSLEENSVVRFVGIPRAGEVVVVAARPGRIKAYAELDGESAISVIQIGAAIISPAVVAVRIRPSSQRPSIGDTIAFQAEVLGTGGALLPERRVAWSVTDPAILKQWTFAPLASQRISYLAALPGTVLVRASSGGVNDTVRVIVPDRGPAQDSAGAR